MRKFLSRAGLILLCFVLTLPATFAQEEFYLPLEAYGLNTVAGFNTFLRTSKTTPNASIVFEVKNPVGEVVTLSAVANANGVAQTELSDYYTEKAGDYTVSARLETDFSNNRVNTLTVYPGEVSTTVSTVAPADQVIRSYGENAIITVQLLDDYNNPIENHLVTLISSSGNDEVEAYSDSSLTDTTGKITFSACSENVGAVTYTAYDVTTDKILDSRAKVAYFDSNDYIFSNNLQANSFAAFGNSSAAADAFKFEDIPTSINVADSITFTLSARDAQDQVVTGYIGTARFSVVGDNAFYANLPEDYTFIAQDLGSHTFSLALSFQQPGTYKVEARDTENVTVFGEYDFVVTTNGFSPGPGTGITLSNPVSGTYSNNIQVISGTATPGAKLKIYDNEIEIASIVADASGAFSFTTNILVDGMHSIYVASVNDVGTIVSTSPIVQVNVDSAAPEISQVVLDPSGPVDPGTIVTVKLYTSEDLSQAALIFQDNIHELTKSAEGYYSTSLAVPIEFGEYPMNFVIVDQLGNESRLDSAAVVNVGGVLGQNGATLLGDVTGLTAAPSDHRVTLSWQAPEVAVHGLKNYRVYYGLSPNQLTEAVDTFMDAEVWYIPNLKNGVEYYFAVVAMDSKGNVSEHFSNIVSSTPNPAVADVTPPEVDLGIAGGEALDEMEKDVSESGPEISWLILLSAIGGIFYCQAAKRRLVKRKDFEKEL